MGKGKGKENTGTMRRLLLAAIGGGIARAIAQRILSVLFDKE